VKAIIIAPRTRNAKTDNLFFIILSFIAKYFPKDAWINGIP
jgi:hypothetical protein